MDNIKKKIEGYKNLNSFVHIIEKSKDGLRHYNGFIIEVYDDIFILKDRFQGEVVIVFDAVVLVEPSEVDINGM